MKDADLKRNASGYYDEPCYKACTALPKPGEIWQHSRSGDYMLILAVNERVVSILKLTDRECTDGIQVVCKSVIYTSPAMVAYAFIESVGDYVKSLKAEEFRDIKTEVAKALGFETIHAVALNNQAIARECDKLQEDVLKLTKERDEALKQVDDLQSEQYATFMRQEMEKPRIADMEQEISGLRIYKELYMDIIDKLVFVRGGTVNDQQ